LERIKLVPSSVTVTGCDGTGVSGCSPSDCRCCCANAAEEKMGNRQTSSDAASHASRDERTLRRKAVGLTDVVGLAERANEAGRSGV
jgi:hypothetical protein